MTILFAKSPSQMRREAEEKDPRKRKSLPKPLPKPGPAERAKRPRLDPADWSAHVRTGTVS